MVWYGPDLADDEDGADHGGQVHLAPGQPDHQDQAQLAGRLEAGGEGEGEGEGAAGRTPLNCNQSLSFNS